MQCTVGWQQAGCLLHVGIGSPSPIVLVLGRGVCVLGRVASIASLHAANVAEVPVR